jgi:cobalt-zinc-cadmium efflux system membrane fusion protein
MSQARTARPYLPPGGGAPPSKRPPRPLWKIAAALVGLALVLAGGAVVAVRGVPAWWAPGPETETTTEGGKISAQLAGTEALRLPGAVAETLGVRVVAARELTRGQTLELSGSLSPDTDRLVPLRSRFAGEVIQVAEAPDPNPPAIPSQRPVTTGDPVEENQLLAVVWSKDLGEKKSELVDALSQLRLDQDTLKRLQSAYSATGAIPEQSIRETERSVAADRIAASKAELTLRSWRLTDAEIEAIYKDADKVVERVRKGQKAHDKEQEAQWARVEVRAPFAGTILEKNFAVGAVIDTTTNLFMIGDLSHLNVFAYAHEGDLPALQQLPRPIPWSIRLENDPSARPLLGVVSEIRPLVDPTMHAALVRGRVANPKGRLLSGQFVTAMIDLAAPKGEVEVPTTALVEDGHESVVFVQPTSKEPVYQLRRVTVVRRTREKVYLRSRPEEGKKGDDATMLRPGELVVTAGALLLRQTLKDLQDAARAAAK